MKNKEKFQDQLIEAFSNGRYCEFKYNYIFKKGNCTGHSCQECSSIVRAWFEEEYKEAITLSHAEKIILDEIIKEDRLHWLARDMDGELTFYENKPIKGATVWNWVNGFECMFKHLFKFVTWEDDEPYNIKELLKITDSSNF